MENRDTEESDVKAIFELAGIGIGQIDLSTGKFLRVNRKYCEITGYSAAELREMSFKDVTHPEDLASDESAFQRAISGESPEYLSEKRYIRRDGTVIWVMVNAVVIRNTDGEPVRTVGVISEITERKKLEKLVAEQADREREHLGEELHDGLGQQLTSVGMLLATLKDENAKRDADDGKVCELIDKLEASVQQAKSQVRDLLNGLFPVDVDGRGLVAALERLADETGQLCGADCRFIVDDLRRIQLDAFRSRQVYLIAREAAHNAAKHAAASEILIRVETEDGIYVSVIDNGTGFRSDAEAGMGRRIMLHRAAVIGAQLTWTNNSPHGTIVRCQLSNT